MVPRQSEHRRQCVRPDTRLSFLLPLFYLPFHLFILHGSMLTYIHLTICRWSCRDRYLNDFSKALASEVRILLAEVGKLRDERRQLQLCALLYFQRIFLHSRDSMLSPLHGFHILDPLMPKIGSNRHGQ